MKFVVYSLLIAAHVSAFAARPVQNAFIDYPVKSVYDLVQEVRRDPNVADRYVRHFQMTREKVLDFLNGLHLDRLRANKTFEVYSVPPDGHIKMHPEEISAGTAIFSDQGGKPILSLKCGNPLTAPSPVSALETPTGIGASLATIHQRILDPNVQLAMEPPMTPSDLYVPPAGAPMEFASSTDPFTGSGAVAGSNASWLAAVASGGMLYGVSTIAQTGNHPTMSTAPEPGCTMLFGLCGVGLLFRVGRRRTKPEASN